MVVRMRSTRSHTGNRRSHHALKAQGFVMCSNCGNPKEKHAVCSNCGMYKGKLVVNKEAELKKKAEKGKTEESK